MGLSLADAAVRGNTSNLTDEKRALLAAGDIEGLLALNRSQFGGFFMGPEDDDDDDNDDDTDDGADDDDDDDDDEDEDGKSKRKPKADAKDLRIRDLSAESKKYRLRSVARGNRVKELEAEIEALKKGKPAPKAKKDDEGDEGDDTQSAEELRKAQEALNKSNRTNEDLLIRLEFMGDTTYKWKNPKAALRLLDLSEVEITDDGEVEGLEDAIAALAKSDPYLLDAGKDDDEDDEDDKETKRRQRKSGQPTGSRKKGNPNRDALIAKYPGLRR